MKFIFGWGNGFGGWSLPVWERGLKSADMHRKEEVLMVAPRVGAWIEMRRSQTNLPLETVAPRVGAWIEI